MSSLNKNNFFKSLLFYIPSIFLFLSVLNEIDLNYSLVKNFSFNFVYVLIFYWTLKNPRYLSYGAVFFAGLINDVITGSPIGLSSFCYLLICGITAYLRNITLTPNFLNDWIFLLITVLLVNSINIVSLDLIFSFDVSYMRYFINSGFTFILYPVFIFLFDILERKIQLKNND